MRNITREEVVEYFDFCRENPPVNSVLMEQVKVVAEVALDHNFVELSIQKMIEAIRAKGKEPTFDDYQTFVISMFASTFLMGREFESRLLVKDLRDTTKAVDDVYDRLKRQSSMGVDKPSAG